MTTATAIIIGGNENWQTLASLLLKIEEFLHVALLRFEGALETIRALRRLGVQLDELCRWHETLRIVEMLSALSITRFPSVNLGTNGQCN